jgi:hypothetical protein
LGSPKTIAIIIVKFQATILLQYIVAQVCLS